MAAARWLKSGAGCVRPQPGHSRTRAAPHTHLQEAADLLASAAATEASLLSAATAPAPPPGPLAPPAAPVVLQRGPCYVELTNGRLTGRGIKEPATFACYCKPAGAGVALSINRTAMELPGRVGWGPGCAVVEVEVGWGGWRCNMGLCYVHELCQDNWAARTPRMLLLQGGSVPRPPRTKQAPGSACLSAAGCA